jgi:DNA-binding NtrC family response regulator
VDLPIWRKSHADIVNKAISVDSTFNIIVVGTLPDIEQCASAIERGAFDYVAPPFSHETLTLLVHSAAMDARERRESLARVFLTHAPV